MPGLPKSITNLYVAGPGGVVADAGVGALGTQYVIAMPKTTIPPMQIIAIAVLANRGNFIANVH